MAVTKATKGKQEGEKVPVVRIPYDESGDIVWGEIESKWPHTVITLPKKIEEIISKDQTLDAIKSTTILCTHSNPQCRIYYQNGVLVKICPPGVKC